jgi:DNA polymerase-3 subunit beta
MIFTASCDQLAAVISRAASGLPAHPLQDTYTLLHMITAEDSVWLTAGDGDTAVTATGAALVTSGGSCVVRGRMLAEMSRYLSGSSVTFEYRDRQLLITAGRSRFTLPAAGGDTYPKWAQPPAPVIWLDGGELTAAIRRVAPAAADGAPPALTAIRLEAEDGKLVMVATDTARMAYVTLPIGDVALPPALLPARAARRLAWEGETGIGWDDALIGIEADGIRMVSRQIAGPYLPWRKVMGKEPGQVTTTVDVKEMTRALRMAQLAAGNGGRVELALTGRNGVTVSAGADGQDCAEHVDAEYDGGDVTFLFGVQDVLDGLAGCGEERAGMTFTKSSAPLFIRDGEYRWMVAPRREL